MTLRVVGASLPIIGDIECNHDAIDAAMDFAIENQADILLTPEGSLSGYHDHFNQQKLDQAIGELLGKAKKNRLGLALGTCFREPTDNQAYNEIRFYSKTGEFLGFHSKIVKTTGEFNIFKSSSLRTFQFEKITIGGLICNDMWANPECTPIPDPHLTQELAKLGAKIIFHAVNGGRSDKDPFMPVIRNYHESNLRMRARAGKLWIVTVDNCFPLNVECSAPCGIIDPNGNWVIKAPSRNEQYFFYDIPL